MRSITKFWWIPTASTLCFVTIFTCLFFFFRYKLNPENQAALLAIVGDNFLTLALATVLTIGILIWGLVAIFHSYIEPTRRIADEMMIIHSANPAYRIDINGVKNFDVLATLINETANRYQSLQKSIDDRIRLAGEALEEEKNLLASIISCLAEAVIVCNPSGNILLFNKKTEEYLSFRESRDNPMLPPSLIGLGQNIGRYLNASQVNRAFFELSSKISQTKDNHGTCFATLGPAGHFLKVEVVPILKKNDHRPAGYVLRIKAIPSPQDPPENSFPVHRGPTDRWQAESPPAFPLCSLVIVPLQLQNVLETLKTRLMDRPGITLQLTMPDQPAWIYGDDRYFPAALTFLLSRLRQLTGAAAFTCIVSIEQDYFHLDIVWHGHPLDDVQIKACNSGIVCGEDDREFLSLEQIFSGHQVDWWSSPHQPSPEDAALRIFIPAAEPGKAKSIAAITIAAERPEFFDFDLLNRPESDPDLQGQMLANLSYTVIDTETTGLDPSTDDIISIGAVRIVNGRLLHQEVFNVLVDPQRDVPEKSIKIHGIRREMLQGQPTIEKVLPQFYQFVGNTVLVGHNVAFDMRMFQVKEYIAPVRFTQPVLDVMFLSAIVHPSHRRHSLEAISERLGIPVTGRHTALGDAITAGEILLKCLPILARKNILTLRDAIQASKRTRYAKLSY